MNSTYKSLLRQSIHVDDDFSGYLRHISENSDYDRLINQHVCVTVYACECAAVFFAKTNLFYLATGVLHTSCYAYTQVFEK